MDLVINLDRENTIRDLRALLTIGYQLKIPVTPEQFMDPALREEWRRDKNMVVLQLWSDAHHRSGASKDENETTDLIAPPPSESLAELARQIWGAWTALSASFLHLVRAGKALPTLWAR